MNGKDDVTVTIVDDKKRKKMTVSSCALLNRKIDVAAAVDGPYARWSEASPGGSVADRGVECAGWSRGGCDKGHEEESCRVRHHDA